MSAGAAEGHGEPGQPLDRPDGLRRVLQVRMDNNTAERSERGPVVGRKNYYGSGSVWSGRLAAMMFSLSQTLCLWGLNPRLWLTAYPEACAQAGGRAVEDVDRFMPWNLNPEQRRAWGCEDEGPAPDTS